MSEQKNTRCPNCGRTNIYFDGCSKVDCPNRKNLTASHYEQDILDITKEGTYFKAPTNHE